MAVGVINVTIEKKEIHVTMKGGGWSWWGSWITSINSLTATAQALQVGTAWDDFNIHSTVAIHTFNLPTASAVNRGALSSADWIVFNNKVSSWANISIFTNDAWFITGISNITEIANRSYNDLQDLPTLFDWSYSSLSWIPSTFAPSAHTHTLSDITDSGALAWLNTVDTAEIDNGAVTNDKLATDIQSALVKDFIAWIIEVPEDWQYRLVINLPYWLTINNTTTRSVSWTAIATFSINGTNLWWTANAVSTVEVTQNHTTNNVATAWQDIEVTISSNSSCERLSFTIEFTRTL